MPYAMFAVFETGRLRPWTYIEAEIRVTVHSFLEKYIVPCVFILIFFIGGMRITLDTDFETAYLLLEMVSGTLLPLTAMTMPCFLYFVSCWNLAELRKTITNTHKSYFALLKECLKGKNKGFHI